MLSAPLLWLIVGFVLCLTELIFPSAFVAFMMGISAILTGAIAFLIPGFGLLQIALWLIFSTVLVFFSRRWLTPKRSLSRLSDDLEGETLTDIPAGEVGRVLYEGNSWRAICEDSNLNIAAGQKVYVVRRQGNTLVVLPSHLLRS